jgi:hypothetical protein
MTEPTDPEDVTQPDRVELEEAELDVLPDSTRPQPLEADPADVADQRIEVEIDDEADETS